MENKNIIVGQSGGPTAVINASLYGVVKAGINSPKIDKVYGMIHGIEGFMQGKIMDMGNELSDEDLEIIKNTPAAYLGSCRYKLPSDMESEFYSQIFKKFDELNIGVFLYIGGNDSMDTVSKLSAYAASIDSSIRFIGVPKTIDNDLVLTDHTPGYASAAKYVAATVREIALDASVYQQKAVTIVEIMGRHAGWLTAASVLARKEPGDNPLLIYMPESNFDLEKFADSVQKALEKQPNVVVCISEGISDSEGRFICEYAGKAQKDSFGHTMLTGSGKVLEGFIRERFGIKARSVELNVSQRCSGMNASQRDVDEAVMAGEAAVYAALEGETGKMIAFEREPGEEYRISCRTRDVSLICNQEKKFPEEWITCDGTDISDEFAAYLTPMIEGNVERKMKDGLPVYAYRKKA